MNLSDDQASTISHACDLTKGGAVPDVEAILASVDLEATGDAAHDYGYALGVLHSNLRRVLQVVDELTGK